MSIPSTVRLPGFAALCLPLRDYLHFDGLSLSALSPAGEQHWAYATSRVAEQIELTQIAANSLLIRCVAEAKFFETSDSTAAARQYGARALFFFPLIYETRCIGALTAYRRSPGTLGANAATTALALCQPIADKLFASTSWTRAAELVAHSETHGFRRETHQASGWLAAQLNISVAQAQTRLIGYSQTHGISLDHVSRQIIERELDLTAF